MYQHWNHKMTFSVCLFFSKIKMVTELWRLWQCHCCSLKIVGQKLSELTLTSKADKHWCFLVIFPCLFLVSNIANYTNIKIEEMVLLKLSHVILTYNDCVAWRYLPLYWLIRGILYYVSICQSVCVCQAGCLTSNLFSTRYIVHSNLSLYIV